VGCDVFQGLPDIRVIEIPAYVSEDVCRKKDIVRQKPFLGSLRNPEMAFTLFSFVLGMENCGAEASGKRT